MLSLGLVSSSQSPELLARVEAAVASQRAAVDLEPQSAAAYRALAEAYAQHKFMRAASTHLATAVALEPANAEAYRLLGTVLRRTGDEAGTRRAYDAALALDPSFGRDAYFNLGTLTRGPEQLKMYELAAELDPTHRGAWMNLANAHLSAGRVEEQLKALRWLAKIDPVEGRSRLTNALTLQERSLEVARAEARGRRGRAAERRRGRVARKGKRRRRAPRPRPKRSAWRAAASRASRRRRGCRRRRSRASRRTTRAHDGRRHALIGGGAAARGGAHADRRRRARLAAGRDVGRGVRSGEAGADFAVTVQSVAGAFEVHPDRIERPPKTNVRVADFVRLLALRRDVNLTLYGAAGAAGTLPPAR